MKNLSINPFNIIFGLLFALGGSLKAMHRPEAAQIQQAAVLPAAAQAYAVASPEGQVERKVQRADSDSALSLAGQLEAPQNSPAQAVRPHRLMPLAQTIQLGRPAVIGQPQVVLAAGQTALPEQLPGMVEEPEFARGDAKRKVAADAEVARVTATLPAGTSMPLTEAQRAVVPTSLLFSFVGYSFKAHGAAVTALTIMPNLVVSGAADGSVELCDIATGNHMGKFDLKKYGAINAIVNHKNSIAFGTDKGTLRGDSKNIFGGVAKWLGAGNDVVGKLALFYRGTKVSLKEICRGKQGTFLINGHAMNCGIDPKTKAPLLVKSLEILNWEPLQLITVDNDNGLRFHSSVDVFGAGNTTGADVVSVVAKDVGAIAIASGRRVCLFSQNNLLCALRGFDSDFRFYNLESFHTDTAHIHSLCTSPRGHYILSVSQSGEVVIQRFVDDSKRKFATRFKLDKLPTALAISDAGEDNKHMVAFGYEDGTLEVRSIVDQIGLEDSFEKSYSNAMKERRQLYDDGWKSVNLSPDELNELLEHFPEGVIRDRALAMYYNKEAKHATSGCCVIS